MRLTLWLVILLLAGASSIPAAVAAIGDDEAAAIKRYGPFTERGTVNRKADFTLHWDRKDRIITAAFINGKCEMVTHALKPGFGDGTLPDSDVAAILQENSAGQEWKETNPNGSPHRSANTWTRADEKVSAVRIGDILIVSTRDYIARKPRS
jgi:hypothetical protein